MATTYLSRTFGTATNRKICTFSHWVKMSDSSQQGWFGTYNSGFNFRWGMLSDGTIDAYEHNGSAYIWRRKTNRLFRDYSGYYHLMLVLDTTQSTAGDRVKIYVNGVQETSFSSSNDPTLNIDLPYANSAITHYVGKHSTEYFNGIMSHVHFCDGTALAPTVFGETDATTGEWKIKTSPSFTLGTNGFTILKDGNTITDQSTNSNDFSLGGGTLTNTEDNPSNVFNVFSDATSKKAYTSEAGLKVSETASSWNFGVGGTIGALSGKYYWEFYKTASSDNFLTGIIPSSEFHRLAESTASAVYNNANAIQVGASTSWWYKIGTAGSTTLSGYGHGIGTKSSGLFQLALDLTNKKMWIGKDGTWYNSGNPATGANPLWTGSTVFPDDIYVPYWQGYGTVSGRFNFGGGSFGSDAVASAGTNASANGVFELDVPTGFTALSTKGLNL